MCSVKSHENVMLLILALCSFFVGLDSIITVPLLPSMAESANIPINSGALLVSSYALIYMITAPLFGVLSDYWGRKKIMLLGMFVLALGTVLTGFGTSFAQLLIFRALTGLGAGMLEPAVFAYVGDKIPYERRGRAMGIVTGALIGSTLFGVPLGTLLAQFGSWHWTFWGIGLLALLMVSVIYTGLPKENVHTSTRSKVDMGRMLAPFRPIFTNRAIGFAVLATFLWFGGLQGMFANMGVYYSRFFDFEELQIGFALMAAGFGSVAGTIIGGKLADLFGKSVIIGYASVFTALGVLGVSLANWNVWMALGIHVLWATAFGFGHAALHALISELAPDIRGTVLSVNSSVMYGGMMAATSVSAWLLHGGGFTAIGLICALAAILVLPVSRLIVREQKGNEVV